MAPCLLLQTVPEVKATGAYDWSKASRAMDKKPGAFLNNAKRWPGCGRTPGMRCVIARAAPARDGVFLRLYGRRMLPEPVLTLNAQKGRTVCPFEIAFSAETGSPFPSFANLSALHPAAGSVYPGWPAAPAAPSAASQTECHRE